jgi:hypothetical protein
MCHLPLVSRNQQPTNCELFAAAISICMTALQVVFYATAGAAGGTGNLKLDQAMSLEPAPIFVSHMAEVVLLHKLLKFCLATSHLSQLFNGPDILNVSLSGFLVFSLL